MKIANASKAYDSPHQHISDSPFPMVKLKHPQKKVPILLLRVLQNWEILNLLNTMEWNPCTILSFWIKIEVFLFTVLITFNFSKQIGYFSIFSLLTGFLNPLLIF